MKKIISFILFQLFGIVSISVAQYSWNNVGSGMNFPVQSLAVDTTNNLVYAGGIFTQAGGLPAIDIAKWDGVSWAPVGGGVLSGSGVSALLMKDGELYAGGSFTNIGGILSKNIAKWDGLIWTPLGSGLEYTGATTVSTMCVFGTDLYAGGTFDNSGGTPISYVARWDGTSWQPLSTGTNGSVLSLCVYNGELYAGGQFTNAGGVIVKNIAKWDGTSWSDVGGGAQKYTGATTVSTMKVYSNELYVGGTFDTVGGVLPVNNIAKWDGFTWTDVGGGARYTGATTVSTMKVFNSELVVGGTLDSLGAISANYIGKWNGAVWTTLGTGMNNSVLALESLNDTLYAGGYFTLADGGFNPFISEWTPDIATNIIAAKADDSFTVYPNPAEDKLFFRMKDAAVFANGKAFTFKLYDVLGKELIDVQNSQRELSIDRSGIVSGLYLYRISDNEGKVIQQGKISFK